MDFGYVPLGGEGTPTKYCFYRSVISQSEKREFSRFLSRPSLCPPLFCVRAMTEKKWHIREKEGGENCTSAFFFAFPLVSEPPFP